MTITEFLLARIAEDEAEWTLAGPDEGWWFEHTPQDKAMSARMLAECEAKRRIVDLHAPVPSGRAQACATCLTDRVGYSDDWGPDDWPCDTLRALALPYADHPDFREEWRP